LDIGAYKGELAQKIYDKYKCHIQCFEPVFYDECKDRFKDVDKVIVWNYAISNFNGLSKFHINKDASGMNDSGEVEVNCVTIDQINIFNRIGLIKINIEGEEYNLLDDMISKAFTNKCINIQVQFHKIEGYKQRYEQIKSKLELTHKLTFKYPFVWENWRKI
jgi:FkbM family methyltransferase